MEDFASLLGKLQKTKERMTQEISKVIIGQRQVIDQMLAGIFSRGHCLLVGVPGLAKTMMVKSLAQILDLKFKRIQFTPDLMPSDITGTNILEEPETGRRDFRFIPGPLFANIVLADEINRTPPKTQAALLEAMQERQVTVGQETYSLPEPYFVIATQNPIEQEGTYPLPEAQLDRFMLNIHVDYPAPLEEEKILARPVINPNVNLKPLLSVRQILEVQKIVERINTSDYCLQYVARILRATRPQDNSAPKFVREMVDWGVSPRAGQHLIMAAKALAAMDGRPTIAPSDIQEMAVPVLRHRIAINFQAQAQRIDSVAIIRKLLETIPEPEVEKYE